MSAVASIISRFSPWARAAELGLMVVLIAAAFWLGWHERDVRAARDTAAAKLADQQAATQGAQQLAEARQAAIEAAGVYAEKAAKLRPQLQVIHDKAAPVLQVLHDCPVPATASSVLDAAGACADSSDGQGCAASLENGPGPAPANVKPADGK